MTKEEAIKELEEYLQDADKAISEDEEYIRGWKSAFLVALEVATKIDGKSATPDKIPAYPCIACCSPSERAACCGCPKERQWQEKYGKHDTKELLECHDTQKNLVGKWRGRDVTYEPDNRVIFHFNNTTEVVNFMRMLEAEWR